MTFPKIKVTKQYVINNIQIILHIILIKLIIIFDIQFNNIFKNVPFLFFGIFGGLLLLIILFFNEKIHYIYPPKNQSKIY